MLHLNLGIDCSAASTSMVHAAPTTTRVPLQPPARDVAAEQRLLSQVMMLQQEVAAGGSFQAHAVPFLAVDGFSSEVVDALAAVGALARQNDQLGETNLAVVSTCISWSVTVVISEPMLAARVRLEVAVTKIPKVEWLVRLHSDG